MTARLRVAVVAPVATTVPPPRSGSIELLTAHLTDGLLARGHDVTLFATGDSTTRATLQAAFPRGYRDDAALWPWELCELMNLAAAIERADEFDVIHCQSEYYPMSLAFGRLTRTPVVHTVHYSPAESEVAIWRRYPDQPFIAVSAAQAARLSGLRVVGMVHHGVDTDALPYQAVPGDYLLFLGRFIEGKGVGDAIRIAQRAGLPLHLAAEANDYYREAIAPLVDGTRVVYAGEVTGPAKAALLGGARALLYPVQKAEPFGLVLAEAMACGTPVAALDTGAVRELVDDGVTGGIFATVDALVDGLPGVMALDRAAVRAAAVSRFGLARMVDAYAAIYASLAAGATRRNG